MIRRRLTPAVLGVIVLIFALMASTASAQEGVTIIRGFVTINGEPAPEETQVRISLEGGGQIASTLTGFVGLSPNEFMVEVESDPAYENQTIVVTLPGVKNTGSVKATFELNTVIVVNVDVVVMEPTPTPTPRPGVALVEIPSSVTLSPEGVGVDSEGEPVGTQGGDVILTEPGQPIAMPIEVPSGRTLEEFKDPVTGLTVRAVEEGYLVRIPIRDADGNDQIRVLATTGPLSGTGLSVEGTVISMGIDLPTLKADLSALDTRVGVASVKVIAEVVRFPADASLELWLSKDLDEQLAASLASVLLKEGLEIDDIPFAVNFDERNLEEALGELTLRLGVGQGWVNSFPVANIVGFHVSDDGTAEIIDAPPLDLNADPVIFTLISPGGLSGFGLAALRKAKQLAATQTAVAAQTQVPTATSTPLPPTPTAAPTIAPTAIPTAIPAPPVVAPVASPGVAGPSPVAAPAESPRPVAAPIAPATAEPVATTAPPVVTAPPAPTAEPDESSVGGGACSLPTPGTNRVDLGMAALLVGLIALRVRRLR